MLEPLRFGADWPRDLTTLTLLLAVAQLTTMACAAPCTLYKAHDIANARENVKRYEWARRIVGSWDRTVGHAMKQDRGFFEQMISDLTPWPLYGQNCPVCVGQKSSMGECGIWKWSVTAPDQVICKYCGTAFPHPDYAESGSMTCPRMAQTFTYYETEAERAHPEDRAGKYAFKWVRWPVHTSWSGIIRAKKAGWAVSKILPLAKLYAVTGEGKYAERAAWILDRFATVYPKYLFHSYNGTYADCPPAEAAANMGKFGRGGRFPKETIIDPFNRHQHKDYAALCNGFWGAGRFGCSGSDGGTILSCTIGYDLIRDATREDGTRMLTPDMEQRIVNDLILAGCADTEHWSDINNKCGPGRALSAAAGILFKRPESVRRALHAFEKLMADCFHTDGFCQESPSYSGMHLGLMRDIPEILIGYSDPEGYEPEEGERLEDFNPFEHVSRYRLALESMVRMMAPDRRYPVIGDTHRGAGPSAVYVEILADRYRPAYAGLLEAVQGGKLCERGSEYALWYRDPDLQANEKTPLPLHTEWFPGWHVGVLRGGDSFGETALYLNAYAYHGHRHHDTLGIIYYAFGKEMASDRGYIWDDPRNAWTRSTLSHNTVTVDGSNQESRGRTSTLDLFGTAPGIEVVQAHSDNAYRQCDRYQRTCALVQLPDGGTYTVDFFRIRGGELHQYGFQCNGQAIGLTCTPPQPVEDKIKWLSNLRASCPTQPFTVTWEHDGVRMDLMVLNPIHRLLMADAPGWRSDKGSELNAAPIQQLFAERTAKASGGDRLTSNYAAVMAPYRSERSPVRSARLLEVGDDSDALAAVVELDERTDYIVSSLDQNRRQYGPVAMIGHFGFVSLSRDGDVLQAYLLDGTELTCGSTALALAQPRIPLKVASVEGRTYHLSDPVPSGVALAGAYLLAANTGYEIESATRGSIVVRDYPATMCDSVSVLVSAWVGRRP